MRIIASSAVTGGARCAAGLLALALALGGCDRTGSAGPAPGASVRPRYDGVYQGASLPASPAERGCGSGGPVTLLVMGDLFYFRWTPQVNLEVRVAEDGSLRGAPVAPGSAVTMNGAISGSQLRAEVGDAKCRFRLDLSRT